MSLESHPDRRRALLVSDRQIDLVAEQVDLAIRSGWLGDSTLVARKLHDARRLICASPHYLEKHGSPRVPSDLLQHNCLTLAGFGQFNQWPFHTSEGINRLAVSGSLATDNADLLLDAAVAGLGIARLADFVVARARQEGALVPLLEESHLSEPFPVHIVTVPGRHRTPRVKAFTEFMAAEMDGWR